MPIILFFLLVAVWAAVLLPSAMSARREQSVNATPPTQRPAARPSGQTGAAREQVLARRRYALVALGLGAVVTLVGAIVTGSMVLLIATLAIDVMLALYVAVLLQIKQRKYAGADDGTGRSGADEEPPVRVVGG